MYDVVECAEDGLDPVDAVNAQVDAVCLLQAHL